jgi:hypothetical protein
MSLKHKLVTGAGLAVSAAMFALFVSIAPSQAADADPAKEVATASQHAGFAAQATDLKMAQTHLHHVINCLVGPKGKGFDANQLNPCKDMGNGAIPDTKDKAKKKSLATDLSKARSGLRAKKLETVQKDATAAQDALKGAM